MPLLALFKYIYFMFKELNTGILCFISAERYLVVRSSISADETDLISTNKTQKF